MTAGTGRSCCMLGTIGPAAGHNVSMLGPAGPAAGQRVPPVLESACRELFKNAFS